MESKREKQEDLEAQARNNYKDQVPLCLLIRSALYVQFYRN